MFLDGAPVDGRDQYGNTVLHVACQVRRRRLSSRALMCGMVRCGTSGMASVRTAWVGYRTGTSGWRSRACARARTSTRRI